MSTRPPTNHSVTKHPHFQLQRYADLDRGSVRTCREDGHHDRADPAQRAVGNFAPKLVELTDNVLFGDVWERPELSKRDRSLITVASLVTSGSVERLVGHLRLAKQNGLTEAELKEAIIHLAFYAGWPKAMSAIQVAKQVFAE